LIIGFNYVPPVPLVEAVRKVTTIRLKVLKIGAQIEVTVRRVWIRMAAGYPYKEAFQQAFDNLQQIPLVC
jgi:hypothetical protein